MERLPGQAAPNVPNNTALKAIVIILGVLIVLGVAGLIGGVVLGLGPKSPAAQSAEPYTARIMAPAGARITGAEIDGNRLLVHIDDSTLVVLDAGSGRVLGRVTLEAAP